MWKASVTINLKEGVLDPQGKAIRGSLHALGHTRIDGVDVGKHIELWLNDESLAGPDDVKARVVKMCEQLLANPVMERYTIEVEQVEDKVTQAR